jgi:hypothetical protein
MDKAKIAQFSDALRNKLLDETKTRATYYEIRSDNIQSVDEEHEDSIVIGDKTFIGKKIKHQRAQLVREIKKKGYVQVIDEVTYTWFNRFAFCCVEVHGGQWLPSCEGFFLGG